MSVEFYRESPGKFDSRTLNRKTLNRWTGRNAIIYFQVYTVCAKPLQGLGPLGRTSRDGSWPYPFKLNTETTMQKRSTSPCSASRINNDRNNTHPMLQISNSNSNGNTTTANTSTNTNTNNANSSHNDAGRPRRAAPDRPDAA